MNVFDLILIVIFAILIFWGLWKGFVAQLLSLIGMIVSIYFALTFHWQLAMRFSLFSNSEVNRVAFLIICFCLPILIFSFLIYFLNKAVKKSPFSFFNRIMGGVLGAIKAFFFSAMLIYLLYTTLPRKEFLYDSKISPFIVEGVNLVLKLIPQARAIEFYQQDNDSQKDQRFNKTI